MFLDGLASCLLSVASMELVPKRYTALNRMPPCDFFGCKQVAMVTGSLHEGLTKYSTATAKCVTQTGKPRPLKSNIDKATTSWRFWMQYPGKSKQPLANWLEDKLLVTG